MAPSTINHPLEREKGDCKKWHAIGFGICAAAQFVLCILAPISKIKLPAILVYFLTFWFAALELGMWIFFCFWVESYEKSIGHKRPLIFYIRSMLGTRLGLALPLGAFSTALIGYGADRKLVVSRSMIVLYFALCALADCCSIMFVHVKAEKNLASGMETHELEQV